MQPCLKETVFVTSKSPVSKNTETRSTKLKQNELRPHYFVVDNNDDEFDIPAGTKLIQDNIHRG